MKYRATTTINAKAGTQYARESFFSFFTTIVVTIRATDASIQSGIWMKVIA